MKRLIRLGGGGQADLRHDRVVLTPNENAASALGVPHTSLESLARDILGEDRIAHPLMVQRLLRAAVEDVLGSADPEGTARALLPAIKELYRAGAEFGSEPGSERAKRAFEVAQAYRFGLRAHGLVDPAEALWEAAAISLPRRPVLVWGYPRLGRDEIAFVDAVAGDGSTVHLPYSDDRLFNENLETADELGRRAWTVHSDPASEVWEVGAQLEANEYPHLEAEVRGTLTEVKALIVGGVPLDDIVLVARDDAFYGPTVLSVAGEYGVPVRAPYRISLSDTRVGSWLDLLLETMVEGFPFEITARVLSHPLGPGIPGRRWARARKVRPRGREAWEKVGVELSSLDWPEDDTRAGWASRFDALLEAYALKEKVGSWPREVPALANARNAVAWLGEPGQERIPRDRFATEVAEVMRVANTPAHPGRDGVALHTPLSLYGASYRFAFVLGLVEGSFPPPATDDPVLDFRERRRLRDRGVRLELADERARRERLSFWMLLRVPEERLTLSHPKLNGGREALPSPYFGLVGAEPAPPGPRPAASPEEARRAYLQRGGLEDDSVLAHARRSWGVERGREGTAPFDHYDGVLGIPVEHGTRRFSVSELGDLMRCGFKWWSGSILDLSEPEEGEPPTLIGSLYHKALEVAVRLAAGTPDLRGGVLERLEEGFEAAEEELEMGRVRGWEAWRTVYLAKLRRAVEGEDFALPGAELVETEARFFGEWRGFEVVGRVDRIDRTPEGLVFVDYKSNASAPNPDLQLAVYREAAAPALFPGEAVKDAYYYSLTKAERIRAKTPDDETLGLMAEDIETRLGAGRLPPDVLQRVCSRCDFDLVCRRGPRLERKEEEA